MRIKSRLVVQGYTQVGANWKFEISIIGELNFIFDLQIKQPRVGKFDCQSKYVKDFFEEVWYEKCKTNQDTYGNKWTSRS